MRPPQYCFSKIEVKGGMCVRRLLPIRFMQVRKDLYVTHPKRARLSAIDEAVLEYGFDKGLRVKGLQIVQLLAHADVAHRQTQLASDGDGDAALGRAVKFR